MSTTAQSVTVRRAGIPDAAAVLSLAPKFAAASPFASFVPYNEDETGKTLLRCLDRGAVFVAELPAEFDPFGTALPRKIVGALMAEMQPVWHSRQPIARVLSRWVDDGAGLIVAVELRAKFDSWAKAQRSAIVEVDGIVERLL